MEAEIDFDGDLEEFRQKLGQFEGELQDQLTGALDDIMARIRDTAKLYAPVDTGQLRASLESAITANSDQLIQGSVGSDLVYSIIQEIEQPYVRPAMQQNTGYIQRRLQSAVDDAVDSTFA